MRQYEQLLSTSPRHHYLHCIGITTGASLKAFSFTSQAEREATHQVLK
ncbi:hypothetical protein [Lysobacter gummosus]